MWCLCQQLFLMAITAFYFHIYEERQYTHLPIFFLTHGCFIGSPLLTSIWLKSNKWKWIKYSAVVLNIAGVCVFFYPVYQWVTDIQYRDLYLETIVTYLLIYLLPSTINLYALLSNR